MIVIGEKYTTETLLLNSICMNLSSTNCLSEKKKNLGNFKSGSLFGYGQCDIEVPGNLREAFANFPHIFKNINVGRDDIGPFMRNIPRMNDFCLSLGKC